jgi:hypothetical protein
MTSSITTDYVNETEFRAYINTQGTGRPDAVANAITAASRSVDAYCGRYFYALDATYYVTAESLWTLCLGDVDISTSSGFALHTDDSQDGTYSTAWTLNTDYVLEPINQTRSGITGWPYTRIRAVGSLSFPLIYLPTQRETCKLTGTFGWATVPTPVKQATQIIAAQYFKLSDAPLGVAGFGDMGVVRVRDIPQAASLLAPYRKGNSFGIA